jgi:hypothetical protein
LATEPKPAPLPEFGCATIGEVKPYKPEKEEAWVPLRAGSFGDIRFSQSRIVFEKGVSLKLRYLGDWQVAAGFFERYSVASADEPQCLAVYAIEPPTSAVLEDGFRLCGGDHDPTPTAYLLASAQKDLGVSAIQIIPVRIGTPFDAAGVGRQHCNTLFHFHPQR